MWLRCPSSPRYHRFITYSLSYPHHFDEPLFLILYSSEGTFCLCSSGSGLSLALSDGLFLPFLCGVFFTSEDTFLILIVVRRDEFFKCSLSQVDLKVFCSVKNVAVSKKDKKIAF